MTFFSMKIVNRIRKSLQHPEQWWGAVILLFLVIVVVIPVVYIIISSFVFDASGPRMVRGAKAGQWTFFYWQRILTSSISKSIFFKPALHSLLISIGMTAISLTTGSVMAWLVVRTNIPWKRFFSVTLIIPYIVPSWTVALAWIMIFKSRQFGGTPGMLSYLFGIEVPEWICYGYLPIIITLGVHYIPYTFILMRGTLANIDSRLEESAELLGAGRLEVLRIITFPLVLPALGAAFILTFSKGLGGFAAQRIAGLNRVVSSVQGSSPGSGPSGGLSGDLGNGQDSSQGAGHPFLAGRILHPSPASPQANRGWAEQAVRQLQELGVWN